MCEKNKEGCVKLTEGPSVLNKAHFRSPVFWKISAIQTSNNLHMFYSRITLEECTAPLGPFLRRMAKVPAPSPIMNTEPATEVNPTEVFLK